MDLVQGIPELAFEVFFHACARRMGQFDSSETVDIGQNGFVAKGARGAPPAALTGHCAVSAGRPKANASHANSW